MTTPATSGPQARPVTAPGRATAAPAARSTVRSVALPAEHGGWGLTLEPGLLGLLVAPSRAGLCLTLAAVAAFTARTPLKVVAVDLRRGRRLHRTRVAAVVALVELAVLAALLSGAVRLGSPGWWLPALAAVPLVAVEAAYDLRSRSRRLVPELAGAVAVSSVAAMVVLAGGGAATLAVGAWLVLAARAVTSIPHVRAEIARLHHRTVPARAALAGDLGAVALGVSAVVADAALVAGAVGVLAVVIAQRLLDRRPAGRPAVIGVRQMALGFGLVAVTALGVALA